MGAIVIDEKNRVLLDLKVRKTAGLKRGDKLVAIPFRGGVILVNAREKFTGSLKGFSYDEERHEASKFLFKKAR